MNRHSFSKLNGSFSNSSATTMARIVLFIQIALEIAFITIWVWRKQISVYFSQSNNDSHHIFPEKRRQRCRPQHLDLSIIRRQRNSLAEIIISTTSPCPFRTPRVEASSYNDPSVRVEATAETNTSLSPQFCEFAQELSNQLGPLPSHWSIRLSADKRIFFVNLHSGETTWCDPRLNTLGVIMSPSVPNLNVGRQGQNSGEAKCTSSSEESLETPSTTPIGPSITLASRARITRWVAEERSKVRARNARVVVLKSRSRMARMQKFTQPLAF